MSDTVCQTPATWFAVREPYRSGCRDRPEPATDPSLRNAKLRRHRHKRITSDNATKVRQHWKSTRHRRIRATAGDQLFCHRSCRRRGCSARDTPHSATVRAGGPETSKEPERFAKRYVGPGPELLTRG